MLPLFVGCIEVDISLSPEDLGTNAAISRLLTKAGAEAYFLGESEVMELARLRTLEDKAKELDFVDPIYIEENELPVAYVIQYTDGWEVVAADKRVYPTICESRAGRFIDQKENANFQECLYLSELDICEWRLSKDEALLKDESVMTNLKFWDELLNPEKYIEGFDKPVTKKPNPFMRLVGIRLIDVLCDTVSYDTIPHLISTHWTQDYPYNQYVPYTDATLTEHCPVGCTAVSTGQMMYFLHCLLGVPAVAPTTAFVNGYIPDSFIFEQSAYSAQAWNNIANGDDETIAILLANIGKRNNMNYRASGSGSPHSTLPSLVFAPYGISCSYHYPCNPDDAFESLLDGIPVIVAGTRRIQENGVDTWHAHSFLIDRYELSELQYTDRYEEYYLDTGGLTGVIYDRPRGNSPTRITKYGMNWGWGSYYDSPLFYVNGSWYPSSSYHYDYYRDMIYDFDVLEF